MDIEELLKLSVKEYASDLHILPGLPPLMRIYGDLTPAKDLPVLTAEDTKRLLYKTLTLKQQQYFEQKLIFEIPLSFSDVGNFRASIFHQLNGIAAVFRIIPERVPSFEELDLPPIFKSLLTLPHGLILITGPTGSGKSTTQAAMIDFVNHTRACHIITIEDPIEFIHKNDKSAINQIQVGRDTPDIATALHAALRQDPDVILLGEMRDLDTIRSALTAAETGHLVIATLHASTAPLAVSRMVDVFPASEKNRVRNMLAETLQAAICQALVKKSTGGRVAAFEIMLATPAIRHLIRQDMTAQMESTLQTQGDIGMCTMAQYLENLVVKRVVNQQVVRNFINNRDSFRAAIEKSKIKK